ncbi:MAG: hypothetical protein JNL97_06185 [Verrucomicrobiales bacterium]|nr:hypothetical protein [Verrucomicrobiales bacterium]
MFLHVDATHRTLNASVGGDPTNPIQEVWRWNPPSVAQFTTSPAAPATTSEWTSWNRTNASSALQRLTGDGAYLVRVGAGVTSYVWDVKGKPVPPRHVWSVSGLNLVGFPTMPGTPPSFATFLAQAPDLQSVTPEIYRYVGGDLGPTNPVLVAPPTFATTPVPRGQAFWMRAGTAFQRYFGPFEVQLSSVSGLDFGTDRATASVRLRNLTTSALTVRGLLQASAAPPANQPAIAGEPPILVRVAPPAGSLVFGASNWVTGTVQAWRLEPREQPGSEVEGVLGLNRSAMTQPEGTLLAGILRFVDAPGLYQIHVPVSAVAGSRSGLWVGDASVDRVAQSLKIYERQAGSAPEVGPDGRYVVTGLDTALTSVTRPYPLRLIVHDPAGGGATKLLQRVYYGLDRSTNTIASSGESALHPGFLGAARRISAPHLPWMASNAVWAMSGKLGVDTNLSVTVAVAYDDQASNPFLHTYHPDHDNRTATFDALLPVGAESYRIERAITLVVEPPTNDFDGLVNAGSTLQGEYRETLGLIGLSRPGGTNDTRRVDVRGRFRLQRISDVPELVLAP